MTPAGKKIDLHAHSTASDGALRPSEVVLLAARLGLHAVALTDHDTIAGHEEALQTAHRAGMLVVPGIEVSALEPRGEVHVLGYWVQAEPDAPQGMRKAHAQIAQLKPAREARARVMVDKLAAHGIALNWGALKQDAGDAMIGRPHVARALVAGGHVDSMQQAFERWIGEGMPAFEPHRGLSLASAITLIHETGGAAVLAHPALFAGSPETLIRDAIAQGADGIEVHHPSAQPHERAAYAQLAQAAGLIVTGGSDFHAHSESRHGNLGDTVTEAGEFDRLRAAAQRRRQLARSGQR
jgi:3',5'-nucleoside bisphosphate phosphatase